MEAVKKGGAEVVEALKKDRIKQLETVKKDHAEVLEAVKKDHTEQMEAVKKGGAEVMEAMKKGGAEVLEAVKKGHTELLETIKKYQAEKLEAVKNHTETVAKDLTLENTCQQRQLQTAQAEVNLKAAAHFFSFGRDGSRRETETFLPASLDLSIILQNRVKMLCLWLFSCSFEFYILYIVCGSFQEINPHFSV